MGDHKSVEFNLEKVVSYLEKYSEQKYKSPEQTTGNEKQYMTEFRDNGQSAREEYRRFCRFVVDRIPEIMMDGDSPSMWINQGQKVFPYFWTKLTTEEADDFKYNISLTINKIAGISDDWILGVWVSASFEKIDNPNKLNRVLDLEIPADTGIYYVIKTTSDSEYAIRDLAEVRKRYKAGKVFAVSLLKVITGPYEGARSFDIVVETVEAAKTLVPYYEYMMSGDAPEGDWIKSTASEEDSTKPSFEKDWGKGIPVGSRVEHVKFGNGTIVSIGATNFDVEFEEYGLKKLGLKQCVENGLLTIL